MDCGHLSSHTQEVLSLEGVELPRINVEFCVFVGVRRHLIIELSHLLN